MKMTFNKKKNYINNNNRTTYRELYHGQSHHKGAEHQKMILQFTLHRGKVSDIGKR